MTEAVGVTPKRVVGASIKGAGHARAGLPNQDAIAWSPESGVGSRLVVALADGHGSRRCFRSETGSRLAVAVALAVGRDVLAGSAEGGPPLVAPQADALSRRIVEGWRSGVEADLEAHPLTEAELASSEDRGSSGREVDHDPFLAYGTTLLLAVVADAWAMVLQLGDGDILCVDRRGGVRRPIADDPHLLANETTSLCMPSAAHEFRVNVDELGSDGPVVMVLATDGFGNAYPDEESFLKVGPDLLHQVQEGGMAAVAENLAGWLEAAASHSGDDVTAAVVHLGTGPVAARSTAPLPPTRAAGLRAAVPELLPPTVRQDAPASPPPASAPPAVDARAVDRPPDHHLAWGVALIAAGVVVIAVLLTWLLLR